MRRREFLRSVFGVATAAVMPFAASAQLEPTRRIGVLMPLPANDPESSSRIAALAQGLQQAGWVIGTNVKVDYRWSGGDPDKLRKFAAELVELSPNVLFAWGASAVAPLSQATRSIPIVFAGVADPVGAGIVSSLSHPGGNTTGFASFEYTVSGKWPELLKQIVPGIARIGVLRDPTTPSGSAQFGVIQAMSSSLNINISPHNVRDAGDIERAIRGYAGPSDAGLIVAASAGATVHRNLIITQTTAHRVPTIYFERSFVNFGGLISYGSDHIEPFRRVAGYIDRILRGEKPADLPVQSPTKYELAINLKTAKALGIAIPPGLLARADEVIE